MAILEIDDDIKPYVEWIDGRAEPKVSPQRKHGKLQGRFMALLEELGSAAGEVATEWRVYLPDGPHGPTTLVPDVAYISRERLLPLTDAQIEKPPFAPDVAVEIRSPEDPPRRCAEKVALYLKNGSLLVLDVDFETKRITAHSRDGVKIFSEGDIFEHAAAPWLRFNVARIFANLDFKR
jgi:Uma2 family endonuclease